jgi:L-alanine-DL-glutamate epimerase-like enolase superfamily enzyme
MAEITIGRASPTGIHRRRFLKTGLASVAVGGLMRGVPLVAAPPARDLTVTKIDRVTVKVPFRAAPERNMARELPHWKYSEICTVHLQSGHQGHGETLLYYTWGATSDDDVQQALGKNAASLMWDDSLGAGLQMALFDAVAHTCDVPIHRLLGAQVHDRTPLSWWNIDTYPEDMAAECKEAYRRGYLAYKTKGRPWFDIYDQMDLAVKEVPPEFKIDMDFNDTLLNAERGMQIVKDLAKYPQTEIYESPIPQGDIPGNKAIRNATRVKIAMHYGIPLPKIAITEAVCDGFVIGHGATQLLHSANVAAMADMPFWLQLVGTGITAAFSLHFGAVTSHSTWPAVNCHQLYTHQLLKKPITLQKGFAAIPDGPGLGYDIDWDAVDRFRIDKPKERPDPPRIVEVIWKDGKKMYFNHLGGVNFVLSPAMKPGNVPYYERGVTTRLLTDNGTAEFRDLYERSRNGPLTV